MKILSLLFSGGSSWVPSFLVRRHNPPNKYGTPVKFAPSWTRHSRGNGGYKKSWWGGLHTYGQLPNICDNRPNGSTGQIRWGKSSSSGSNPPGSSRVLCYPSKGGILRRFRRLSQVPRLDLSLRHHWINKPFAYWMLHGHNSVFPHPIRSSIQYSPFLNFRH